MDEATYIIKGKPTPWRRSGQSGKIHFDTQKKEKLIYGIEFRNQHADQYDEPWQGPLHMSVTFFMPMPSTISDKKKRSLIGTYHYLRPDLDNLIKFIKDAATGILFSDDAIIASLSAHKIYSSNPHTKIVIKPLNPESVCLC